MKDMTRYRHISLLSFLVTFCIVLTMLTPAAFAAGDESAYLKAIKINGLDVIDFDPEITEYDVDIPYIYDSEVGVGGVSSVEVEAKPMIEGAEVDIDYPDTTDGIKDDVLTVTVDGTVQYTFTLNPVGENMYADGGFESGATSMLFKNGGVKLTNVSDVVYSGSQAMKIERPSYGIYYFSPTPKALAGRKYLLSNMVRLYDSSEAKYSSGNTVDTFKGELKHYDKTGNAKTNGSSEISGDWNQYFVTIVPNSDYDVKNFYTTWGKEKTIVIDDCFAGDLVISDIKCDVETTVEIPAVDEDDVVIPLDLTVVNQFGNCAGLENEIVSAAVSDDYKGAYVDGSDLIITKDALAVELPLVLTAVPQFDNSVQSKVQKTIWINLVPQEGMAILPEARNVKILGKVLPDELLTVDYDYYHILGDAKDSVEIKWMYSDTMDGDYEEIEETKDALNKEEYRLDSKYASGFIKIVVTPESNGVKGIPAWSEAVSVPRAPEARNLTIEGVRAIGQEITGSFTYYDMNGDEKGDCIVGWKRIEADGSYTDIGEKNSYKYKITEDDIDKQIVFCVTPVSITEPFAPDVETKSDPVLAATAPQASKVSINKSNGVLTADYTYYHPNSVKEGVSTCKWYLDGDLVSEGFSYKPDENGKIKVEIIPVAQLAPYQGVPAVAETQYKESSKKVSVSGGGGGGGGITYVPVPKEPEVVEEPEEIVDSDAHWAEAAANLAIEKGIMENPKENDFCYDQKVTRGEFIYYVVKALGLKADAYNYDFQDVLATDRFAKELTAAVEAGIISEDVNYYPGRNVSRQEVCKILAIGMNLSQNPDSLKKLEQFADASYVGEWAKEYVELALTNNVLIGVSDNLFNPLGDITRAETAVLVKRIIEYVETGKVGV